MPEEASRASRKVCERERKRVRKGKKGESECVSVLRIHPENIDPENSYIHIRCRSCSSFSYCYPSRLLLVGKKILAIFRKASFVKLQNSLLDARKFCKIYKTDFIILQRLNFCEKQIRESITVVFISTKKSREKKKIAKSEKRLLVGSQERKLLFNKIHCKIIELWNFKIYKLFIKKLQSGVERSENGFAVTSTDKHHHYYHHEHLGIASWWAIVISTSGSDNHCQRQRQRKRTNCSDAATESTIEISEANFKDCFNIERFTKHQHFRSNDRWQISPMFPHFRSKICKIHSYAMLTSKEMLSFSLHNQKVFFLLSNANNPEILTK